MDKDNGLMCLSTIQCNTFIRKLCCSAQRLARRDLGRLCDEDSTCFLHSTDIVSLLQDSCHVRDYLTLRTLHLMDRAHARAVYRLCAPAL